MFYPLFQFIFLFYWGWPSYGSKQFLMVFHIVSQYFFIYFSVYLIFCTYDHHKISQAYFMSSNMIHQKKQGWWFFNRWTDWRLTEKWNIWDSRPQRNTEVQQPWRSTHKSEQQVLMQYMKSCPQKVYIMKKCNLEGLCIDDWNIDHRRWSKRCTP